MTIKTVDSATAKTWLEKGEAILIDVREPKENASQKIPGAQLHPLRSICCSALPDTSKKIIIHCQKGGRGNNACEKLLSENNNLDIYNLEGGIQAWQEAGLSIEKGQNKTLPLDRQVQLTIGISVIVFGLLGYYVHPTFALGTVFFGAGLTLCGLTGWCGLAKVMAKMPWNQ